MILRRLELQNIRSYLHEFIVFPEGSVLLSGDIGTGKSTILLAIEFALFGIQRGELSGEELLRHGKNEGSVTLTFSSEGKNIIIKRSLKRAKESIKQESGYIIVDNQKMEGTPVELKAKILEWLGYPKEMLTKKGLIYRYTVYTPQEEMKRILLDEKDARLDTLRKIFGIDRYQRIRENAQIYLRDNKQHRLRLEAFIKDLPEKEQQKKSKIDEERIVRKNLDELEPLLNKQKHDLQKYNEGLQHLEKERERYATLKQKSAARKAEQHAKQAETNALIIQQQKITEEISILKKQLAELTEEQEPEKKEDILEQEIERQIKKMQEMREEIAKNREKLKNLANEIIKKEQEILEKVKVVKQSQENEEKITALHASLSERSTVEQQKKMHEQELKECQQKMQTLEAYIRQAASLKVRITRMETCPTCLQSVAESHKKKMVQQQDIMIDEHQQLLVKEKDMHAKFENAYTLLQEKITEFIEKEKELASLKAIALYGKQFTEKILHDREQLEELKELQEKIINRDKEKNTGALQQEELILIKTKLELTVARTYAFKQREREHLMKIIKEKEKMHATFALRESTLQKEMMIIQEELESYAPLIKGLEKCEEMYVNIRQEQEACREKCHKQELQKVSLEKEQEGIQKILMILENDIREKQQKKKESIRLGQLHQWLEDYFLPLMQTMEQHIMVHIHKEFNELFQSWFSLLIEDNILSVRLDEHFTPLVEQNGYETDMLSLSGGEKTSLSLAYRLSLTKVINDVVSTIKTKDIIILDEPTDGFSSEQLDKVRDVLAELNVKQTILVSHESKIESFVDHVIRIEKNEHVSKVISEGAEQNS
ncbi:SMC family ATPase [Candidatus Woesearchaeota archaeon]|nr:SMC family ATPase [Candidatus Woesearchaeota archaeon]